MCRWDTLRNQSLTLRRLARTCRESSGGAGVWGMALEAEVEGGEVAAPTKKKLPIMLIAMIAAAVLVVGGGGAAAYFLFLSPPPAEHAKEHALPETFIFNLPTMTVNLRGD